MTTVAVLQAVVKADTKSAEDAFKRLSDQADETAGKTDGLGKAFGLLGGAAAVGLAAVVGGATAAVASYSSFEQKMSAVKAVSGATDEQFKAMTQTALDLGRDTAFSASQAAEGLGELVKGGLDANTAMQAIGPTLNLAAAGGIGLGEAATIASNALNTFKLGGEDMDRVANQVAGAANASSISVKDYGMSLAAGGAVASAVGLQLEDFTQIVAAMGQAGIKNSDAGTSIKSMLLALANPTDKASDLMHKLGISMFDSEGKIKSAADMAGTLHTALDGMSRQQQVEILSKIFGSDGVRAALILMDQGREGIDKIHDAMADVTAEQVAKTMMDNLNGSLEQMKGSAETLAIKIGAQLAPAIRQGVDALTDFLNSLSNNEALMAFIGQVGDGLAGAIQVGVGAIQSLIETVTNLFGVLTSTGGNRAGFLEALGLTPQLAQDVGAILDRVQLAFEAFSQGWDKGFQALGDVAGEIVTYVSPIAEALLDWIRAQVLIIAHDVYEWGKGFIEWVAPQIAPMLAQLGTLAVAAINWIADQVGPLLDKLAQWGDQFIRWVAPMIPPLLVELGTLLVQMNAWLLGTALPAIVSQLLKWGLAFVEWVAPRIPELIGELVKLNVEAVQWMAGTALPAIVNQLLAWGKAFVEWVAPQVPKLLGALGDLLGRILSWIGSTATTLFDRASTMGAQLVDGFAAGIRQKVGEVINAAGNLAQSAIDSAKQVLGSRSPSRIFQQIGADTVAGFTIGIDTHQGEAVAAAHALAATAIDAANGALQNAPSRRMYEVGGFFVEGMAQGIDGATPALVDAVNDAVTSAISAAEQGYLAIAAQFHGAILGPTAGFSTELARRIRDAQEGIEKAQAALVQAQQEAAEKAVKAVTLVNQQGYDEAVRQANEASAKVIAAQEAVAAAQRKTAETVFDAQTSMAKTAASEAEKAARAAEAAEKASAAAAKKSADDAAKAIQESIKAAKEALTDFQNVVKSEFPAIGKQMALALDLTGAVINDMLAPQHLTAAQEALRKAAKQWKEALGKEFKPGGMAPILAEWVPKGHNPTVQKAMAQAAKSMISQLGQMLKSEMNATEFFAGHWDFLINKLSASGGFLDKMVKAFSDAGKKAGATLQSEVANAIDQLNAMGPLNLDNLLPQGLKGGFQSSLPAGNAIESSYQQQFAGMNFDQIKAFFAGYGLNPDYSKYQSGQQTLEELKQQVLGWFAGIMASGLWSVTTGWRSPINGIDSPYPSTGGIFGGTGGAGATNSANQSVEAVTGETPKSDAPIGRYAGLSRGSGGPPGRGSLAGAVQAALADALSTLVIGPREVTIPVSISGRQVDEIVYDAQRRQIRRTY